MFLQKVDTYVGGGGGVLHIDENFWNLDKPMGLNLS